MPASRSAYYRSRAAHYRRRALEIHPMEQGAAWLILAEEYDRLADQAERLTAPEIVRGEFAGA